MLAYNQVNLLIISYFIFWFPWLPVFGLSITNVLKWGQNAKFFVSLRNKITIFIELKRIMIVKEIPRNGVIWCIEIAPNDL